MGATAHGDVSTRFAIALASAANAMLAGPYAGDFARHGEESRWRDFLPIAAELAHVGFAPLSGSPIERRKMTFAHGGARFLS